MPCANDTTAPDGWCRSAGCPGYGRPTAKRDPVQPDRSPWGTAKHIAATGHRPVGLEIDEVPHVRVSQRARDSFRYHHHGDERAAEAQLRWMLEDFLLKSARDVRSGGYVVLARAGFKLVLDEGMTTITGYETVHRERTWEQVKAGVPSRFSGRRSAGGAPGKEQGPPPAPGPALPPAEVARSIAPAHVHLTARVRTSYAKLRDLRGATDEALDRALRTELAATLAIAIPGDRCDERLMELLAGDVRWLVTRDARSLVGVARLR